MFTNSGIKNFSWTVNNVLHCDKKILNIKLNFYVFFKYQNFKYSGSGPDRCQVGAVSGSANNKSTSAFSNIKQHLFKKSQRSGMGFAKFCLQFQQIYMKFCVSWLFVIRFFILIAKSIRKLFTIVLSVIESLLAKVVVCIWFILYEILYSLANFFIIVIKGVFYMYVFTRKNWKGITFFLNYLVLLYYGIKEFNTYQGFLCYFIPLS